jgi:epoxide hydrolase-like predicted phosphatase
LPGRRFDAVLFDFGGVLVGSPFAAMDDAAPGALDLFLGDYAGDGDHPWHRLERGEMALADYWADLLVRAEAAGVEVDATKLIGLYGKLDVRPRMVDRVRSLRADGYRTAIVTNNVKEAGDTWRAKLPLDELFDAVVDSCEVGMRKPNPAIYQHALGLLGVPPARAVFLDDAPGNVAGAQAAGLTAILVGPSDDEALAALDAVLAEV